MISYRYTVTEERDDQPGIDRTIYQGYGSAKSIAAALRAAADEIDPRNSHPPMDTKQLKNLEQEFGSGKASK